MHRSIAKWVGLSLALSAAATARGGAITSQAYAGDTDSGISSTKTYTHAVDVNGTGETINGVTFVAGGASGTDATHGGGWSYSIPTQSSYTTNTSNLTGSINQLAKDFLYSGNSGTATETLTLTGLTVGKTYKASFYSVGFGGAGGRVQNISDDQGGTLNGYDQNAFGSGNGSLLTDTYTATATSITVTFASAANNASFHQYGFSNEVVAPEPATAGLLAVGGVALLNRRRRIA